MKKLLKFLLEKITGGKDFEIQETEEGGRVDFAIIAPEDKVGMIIGKNGKTIKTLRNLLKVRATLEQKAVSVSVSPKA
jgi:predicted RNA-binding protein YlqC (UPF0109 family)